ncbi:MAG: peptidylprolyl isomerase [Bacteroidota bacterium]
MKKISLLFLCAICISMIGCKEEYPELEDGLYAEFKTTHGDFVAKLHHEKTPLTVANFVALAEGNHPKADDEFNEKPFYNGISFHRIISDFMIQGGDPEGTGQGGPGYKFPDELSRDLDHGSKGILSMANSGPNTNGSQFFITLKPTPHLDGVHTVFGKIALGQEIIDEIGNAETNERDQPLQEVTIEELNIVRKGEAAKNFDAPSIFENKLAELEKEKKEAAKKLQEDFDDFSENFEETESGLRYLITEKNEDGKAPERGQPIKVHYIGKFLDGEAFDNSYDRNQPIELNVGTGRVIPGWDEGLMLLKEGEKAVFAIPSELAYGERGVGPIPPNTPLIFEVELVEVVEK